MDNVTIRGDFYKSFLQFCSNVKHFAIRGIYDDFMIGRDNTWLEHTYLHLKTVRFCDASSFNRFTSKSVKELAGFFQLNPNMHTFTTTYRYFSSNWKELLKGQASIDLLKMETLFTAFCMYHPIRDALNKLHSQHIYERLHLRGIEITCQEDLDLIGTIPAVEILQLAIVKKAIILPPTMTDLKEISFNCGHDIKSPVRFAQNLISVERIRIQEAAIIDILPFIRYSTQVEVLHVERLLYPFGIRSVDVVALNKERAKLDGVCKLTIFVKEDNYLATKWASLPTKCPLVELDRAEAS